MQDRIFYSICFGFVTGVLLRSFLFVNFYFAIFLAVIASVLIFFFFLISENKWGIVAGIFILAFCLGIFRFHIADKPVPEISGAEVAQKVSLSGEIIDAPDIRENNQKLLIEVGDGKEKIKILASVGFGEDFKYGDEINFSGKLEKPENFITDQGKVFDYVNYLRKDGIYYVMNYVTAEVVSHGNGNRIKSVLFSVKEKFLEKMNLVIASPENLLMGGLILGEKASFSQELRQNFINTGTIHIVALSGYNITIVAEWFMKLFSQIPYVSQNLGIGMGIFAILLLILMTGAR